VSKSLSERLAEAIETVCENGMDTRDIVSLFRESEALARRVERAERVKVIETGGSLIATATPAVVQAKAGDTLLLVPVEGGA